MQHSFIIVGDDIATLDTAAEREEAAKLMQHYGLVSASVFRCGPELTGEQPEGRDFCSDGTFSYETPDDQCSFHRNGGIGRCNYCEGSDE